MPIKGYIAGRPISRWEADTDNIDIDYRNLDGRGLGPCKCIEDCLSGKKGCVLKVLFCVVLFFIGIIIGYVLRRNVHEKLLIKAPTTNLPVENALPYIQDFNETLCNEMKTTLAYTANYNSTLQYFSRNIHLAGMPLTNTGLEGTKKWLEMFQFDSVKMKTYSVTLTYPHLAASTLNYVSIMDNRTEVFHSHSNVTADHREYLPFNAYSPSKTVQGKLVYVNYGSVEDFRLLESKGIILNNTIILLRYGKIHPGNKVRHAEERGALGVILYSDPYDFSDRQSSSRPNSWWLPSWAIQSAHVRAGLTGNHADGDWIYTYAENGELTDVNPADITYPSIPVQPISYSDASVLLKDMGGVLVAKGWRGSLPVDYKSGPGFHGDALNRTVQLSVQNRFERRKINNLLAVIHGQYEKDQYVIVGAHHDSWTRGVIDAGTGYAVLVELAKTFARSRKNGWRPRRTIIFAFWDASKYGQLGAFKWAEENGKELGTGAVAYINLDSLIRGNYSFSAESSPMLSQLILDAARSVSCADPEHGPGTTVYDMWAREFPKPGTDPAYPTPKVASLGGDSDYSPFIYHFGIPSLAPAYTYNLNVYSTLPNYPAYSTLDDTLEYLLRYIDPDLRLTVTMSKVIAEVTLRLADSALLPLSVSHLGSIMEDGWNNIQTYNSGFQDNSIDLKTLRTTINNFKDTAENFTASVSSINVSMSNEWYIQSINDQLLRVSRAFIVDSGLPANPYYRHTLISPHPENLNSQLVFPGVISPLLVSQSPREWEQVEEQLAVLITSIQSAIDILNNNFIS